MKEILTFLIRKIFVSIQLFLSYFFINRSYRHNQHYFQRHQDLIILYCSTLIINTVTVVHTLYPENALHQIFYTFSHRRYLKFQEHRQRPYYLIVSSPRRL